MFWLSQGVIQMPLKPGKKNIGPNIKELEKNGHQYNQSLAIALKKAGIPKKRKSSASASKKT